MARRLGKILLIFILVAGWIFSGWPKIISFAEDATSTPEVVTSTPDIATSTPTNSSCTATSTPETVTSTPETASLIPQTATILDAFAGISSAIQSISPLQDNQIKEEKSNKIIDSFNSLNAGALYGRGIWRGVKSGRDWMVDSSSCPPGSVSGGGCLALEHAATAEFENTIASEDALILPYENNIISFYFYPNWTGEPTVAFNLYLRTPDDKSEQVRLDFNTGENNSFYIFLSDGNTDAAVFNLPLKQWHKVELNIDKNNRQARFRVNGGEWTNFVSWMNHSEPIGLLRLRGMVDGDANFYVDDFSVSEFMP